ncbi:MAG TPA: DUF2442 domain-containing protein [Sphingobium sp.]|nr:DUF2442 domain-containing protein [Sphingobium sp.]
MAEISDAAIDAALQRGALAGELEPRAAAVRYDPAIDRVIVDLTNGCTFSFPPRLGQGLESATGDQISSVELSPSGYGLHWADLDIDLSVPGLMAGLFGTRAHMARLAGRVRSTAKAAAARANGTKGGRPRKQAGI